MVTPERGFEILREDARKRGLTPKAWWLGRNRHDLAVEELGARDGAEVRGGRLVEYDGLPVKLLEESPNRFALWCAEGVLEL